MAPGGGESKDGHERDLFKISSVGAKALGMSLKV